MKDRFTMIFLIAMLVSMICGNVQAVNKMLKAREFVVLEVEDLVAENAILLEQEVKEGEEVDEDAPKMYAVILGTTGADVELQATSNADKMGIALPKDKYPTAWEWKTLTGLTESQEDPTKAVYKFVAGETTEKEIELKCGKSSKKVILKPITFEFVTPAGDPVTTPKQSGDGQNEFVFEEDDNGEDPYAFLRITYKVSIKEMSFSENEIKRITDRLYFQILPIENKTISWYWYGKRTTGVQAKANLKYSEKELYGISTIGTDLLQSFVNYEILPAYNSSFGKKWVKLIYKEDGKDVVNLLKQDYEVFYEYKGHANVTGAPNWFYYWKEGGVLPALKLYDVKYNPNLRDFGLSNSNEEIFVGPKSLNFTSQQIPLLSFQNIYVTSEVYNYTSMPNSELDALSIVVAHEKIHCKMWSIYNINTRDIDNDLVHDNYEVEKSNMFTITNWSSGYFGITTVKGPGESDTWNVGLYDVSGAGYSTYGDNEIRARKNEVIEGGKLYNSFIQNKNWSNNNEKSNYK